jgi:hypothetical protein
MMANMGHGGSAIRPDFYGGGISSRWCSSSQDVHRSFLELPSSFLTNQLLRTAAEKLKFGGYLGFSGFLTCDRKFAL